MTFEELAQCARRAQCSLPLAEHTPKLLRVGESSRSSALSAPSACCAELSVPCAPGIRSERHRIHVKRDFGSARDEVEREIELTSEEIRRRRLCAQSSSHEQPNQPRHPLGVTLSHQSLIGATPALGVERRDDDERKALRARLMRIRT